MRDEFVPWEREWAEYVPTEFTARDVLENARRELEPGEKPDPKKGWADPDLPWADPELDESGFEIELSSGGSQPFGEAFAAELRQRPSFEPRLVAAIAYDHLGRPRNPRSSRRSRRRRSGCSFRRRFGPPTPGGEQSTEAAAGSRPIPQKSEKVDVEVEDSRGAYPPIHLRTDRHHSTAMNRSVLWRPPVSKRSDCTRSRIATKGEIWWLPRRGSRGGRGRRPWCRGARWLTN